MKALLRATLIVLMLSGAYAAVKPAGTSNGAPIPSTLPGGGCPFPR